MSFLEDNLGQDLVIGSHLFTADDIIAFARKYDPQPFHLDAEAAKKSVFGGLCASGWHTTAVFMKLNVASIVRATKEMLERGETPRLSAPRPASKTSNGRSQSLQATPSPTGASSARSAPRLPARLVDALHDVDRP